MSSLPLEGGLLDRFLFDSFVHTIRSGLEQIGWFEPDRYGQEHPINWRVEPVNLDQEIPHNTVVPSFEDLTEEDGEIGSTLTLQRRMAWVDIYAESFSLGLHLSGDIRAILGGKMPSIGRDDPSIMVVDWSEPEPRPELVLVDVLDIGEERSHTPTSQRNWFAVRCTLEEARP